MRMPFDKPLLAFAVTAAISACGGEKTDTVGGKSPGPGSPPTDAGSDRGFETARPPDARGPEPVDASDGRDPAPPGREASALDHDAGVAAPVDATWPPHDANQRDATSPRHDAASARPDAPVGSLRCLSDLLAEALAEPLGVCVRDLGTSSDFLLCSSGQTCAAGINGCLTSHPIADLRIALAPEQPATGAEFDVEARLHGWDAVYPLTTDGAACEVRVSAPTEGVDIRGHFSVEPLRGASACTDFHSVHTGVGTNVALLSYSMSAAPSDLTACEAQLPRAQAALRDLIFDGVFFGFSAVARRYQCRLCEDGCEGGVACADTTADP